ncbi:hypothetical protein ACFU8W_48550 [Streptomyces sp. NPDC057565]|uniref:hypothetical protein n=1 Tax=Streptomyces sp. NPDC057565 TaxID=3346169 RepID=UPI00367D3E0F
MEPGPGRPLREGNGSVGLTHLAPALPESALREGFAAAARAALAEGREPELDEIALVRSPDELAGLVGPHSDYLEPVVRRFTRATLRRDV